MGKYLLARLQGLQDKDDCVGDVRGRGLLVGLEFVQSTADPAPALGMAARVGTVCLERGLSIHAIPTGKNAHCLRIAPPLTITTEEIDFAIEVLDQSIAEITGS
jgi:2,2-dialkylglycine decarboxylase (pyruvate)